VSVWSGGKVPCQCARIMFHTREIKPPIRSTPAVFALNSGEVCTCPSRALIEESIYDAFMERALKRVAKIKLGE
jgi:acyl-CoA reductase-like NAD-dependent aldehyde dehydrogenase